MTTNVRLWIAGATFVAVASLAYLSAPSYAGDEKEIKTAIGKITEAVKKGDKDTAKKVAVAISKKIGEDDLGTLMYMFKLRSKGGLGWGSTPLINPAKDGIEVQIRDLARDGPVNVAKTAPAAEEAGYAVVALAEIIHAKAPTKDMGKKTKKAWTDYSKDMYEGGIALSKAAAAKGGGEMKTAAGKVNNACNGCHSIFKD